MGILPRLVRPLVSTFCLAGLVLAQNESVRAKAGVDPYTLGQPEALKKAGYVSYGPFDFGTGHTTMTVEELLGGEPLIWIETEHFKIGCALSPIKLRGRDPWMKDWLKSTKAEIDELRAFFPNIKKRVKVLDPWLRAHLIALRLEKLYDEVLENLGRDDKWFEDSRDPTKPESFTGLGPYLGMGNKFTVLLVQKASSIARYTRAYHGRELDQPTRYCDIKSNHMYWGASEETAEGLFKLDPALHAHLYFNVAHNLYSSYRSFGHDLPTWVATGLGHYHSRKVSPRFPTFDRENDDDKKRRSHFWEWGKRVKGLTKNEAFESLDEFVMRDDAGKYGVENHMQAWSVMEFLLKNKPKEMASFLHAYKEPFHNRQKMPTPDELKARHKKVLESSFGCDVAALEAQWRKSVLGKRGR